MEYEPSVPVTLDIRNLINNLCDDLLWVAAIELIGRLDMAGSRSLEEYLDEHIERLEKRQKANASRKGIL